MVCYTGKSRKFIYLPLQAAHLQQTNITEYTTYTLRYWYSY